MPLLSPLLAASVALGPLSDPAPDELERALALLDALDSTMINIDADDEPLAAVLERIGERIPLLADWEALDLIAVSRDDPVTLRLDGAPVATALATLCLQTGDVFERPIYEAYREQIVLTTHEAATRMRLTDVYDVRDLLVTEETLDAVRATRPPAPAEAAPADPDGDPDAAAEDKPANAGAPALPEISIPARAEDAPPPRRLSRGEALMTLLVEHVDPDAWLGFGGTRASISEHDGVLMVSAVPGTHRRLRDALSRLRRAHLTTVSIDAAVVDVARADFERLRRRHDMASAALGRALLAAPGASVRWQAASGAALDRQLMLDARRDGVEMTLRLVPRFDRAAGLLTLDVEAETTSDGERRALATSVTIPFRSGASVLEIPAATAGEEVRLLVLIPAR